MSDLIDFDSPSTNNVPLLASPLIPVPENLENSNDASSTSGSGTHFIDFDKRRSVENNPFDMVMKEITEYEKNKEDPFERVNEKAMSYSDRVPIESKDDFVPRRTRHSDILKLNKMLDETVTNLDLSFKGEKGPVVHEDIEMSIITDLNNTNLISDMTSERRLSEMWSCDNKIVLNISVSSVDNADLSILNASSMNDSLLDLNSKDNKYVNPRVRSLSQTNFLSSRKGSPQKVNRRSYSVTDSLKHTVFGQDSTLNSATSSVFDDPLNNAFKKNTLDSNGSSGSSYLNNHFDLSINKQNMERLNSDSSIFSGLSNVSNIPRDPMTKIRQERFCSDGSLYSSISNLSIIPNGNISTSCDSAFSNDAANKGFIASRLHLSSTSSSISKTPLKTSDKTDIIQKYSQIKKRMSSSQMEFGKDESEKKVTIQRHSKSYCEKLIDVDSGSNSVFNDEPAVNDIILHEANSLAERFEKLASSKTSNSTLKDDLFFSKTQLNFDDLPLSDDETVDNLIDLPCSPLTSTNGSKTDEQKQSSNETSNISPKENMKALEDEFIEPKSSNKKVAAATLLLELEKLIKEDNNPNASKVLGDLQKLLGVECDNNTEILKVCQQNTNNCRECENKSNIKKLDDICEKAPENILEKEESKGSNKKNNSNSKDIEENKENILNNDAKSNIIKDKEEISNNNETNDFQNSKVELINQNTENEPSENKKLVTNLLKAVNKILNEEHGESAVNILRNLGTVLSMTNGLGTQSKTEETSERKETEKNSRKQLINRSANLSFRSPSSKNVNSKLQNKSFDVLPLRRSILVNPANSRNLLSVSHAADKSKTHLLDAKKHFPSDPGLTNPVVEKRKSVVPNVAKEPSSLGTGKRSIDPVKTKLKKKPSQEIVSKRGPLKAVIPLGSMQKQGSVNPKISVKVDQNCTPPNATTSLTIVSSTPNSNESRKTSKTKPTASSTPNVNGLRVPNTKTQQTSKNLSTSTRSPVSLKPTLNVRDSMSKNSPKNSPKSSPKNSPKNSPRNYFKSSPKSKVERNLSPPKRTRKTSESGGDSRLLRYSPRPVRMRNYSMTDLKTVKTPQNSGTTSVNLKISSEKIQRKSISSPLKNCNTLERKGKPMNLVSRLGKHSMIKTGPEKENYA